MASRTAPLLGLAACAVLAGCGILSGLDDLQTGDAGAPSTGGASSSSSSSTASASSGATGGGSSVSSTASSTASSSGTGGQGGSPPDDYAALVKKDGPIAYWRLGEPAGSITAVDEMGKLNGAYTGTPTFGAAGAIKNDLDTAVEFDTPQACDADAGTKNSGVSVSDPSHLLGLVGKQPFTIEAWVRPTCLGNDHLRILERTEGAPIAKGYQVQLTLASGLVMYRYGAADSDYLNAGGSFTLGEYRYLVITFDGIATVDFYLDGTQIASKPAAEDIEIVDGPLKIGTSEVGNFSFGGSLDEVAIYDKPLTTTQITAHFMKGIGM